MGGTLTISLGLGLAVTCIVILIAMLNAVLEPKICLLNCGDSVTFWLQGFNTYSHESVRRYNCISSKNLMQTKFFFAEIVRLK